MEHHPTARFRSTCGGAHRLMEMCPAKPTFFDLLSAWMRGEHKPMAWLAVGGLCVFVVLMAMVIPAAST